MRRVTFLEAPRAPAGAKAVAAYHAFYLLRRHAPETLRKQGGDFPVIMP
jgi:hypothetical protein